MSNTEERKPLLTLPFSIWGENMDEENEMILQEIRDHAQYWHSDRAKRITVEKHLKQKGVENVEAKIDELVKAGKLIVIPRPRGDYLHVCF
jgi:hypothetical protein